MNLSRRSLLTLSTASTSKGSSFQNAPAEWKLADFEVGEFLGKGKFGVVYKATHIRTSQPVALKIITKDVVRKHKMVKQLRRELEIHSKLKHPHIMLMYGFFVDKNYIYVVLEYVPNGNLYTKLCNEKQLSEELVAKYVFQILSAIGYSQARKVSHRDLKLENVLIDQNGDLKIGDFGWSVHNMTNARTTICGTIDYLAPELVNEQEYDDTVDIWCLGIIMFEMLYGYPPFYSKIKEETMEKIKAAQLVFKDSDRVISPEAKDLLSKMLQVEPEKRIKVEGAIPHEFFTKNLGAWHEELVKTRK